MQGERSRTNAPRSLENVKGITYEHEQYFGVSCIRRVDGGPSWDAHRTRRQSDHHRRPDQAAGCNV
jgi:hypothetical protein